MIKCVRGTVEIDGNSPELVAELMSIMTAMNTVVKKDAVFSKICADKGLEVTALTLMTQLDALAKAKGVCQSEKDKYPTPVKSNRA